MEKHTTGKCKVSQGGYMSPISVMFNVHNKVIMLGCALFLFTNMFIWKSVVFAEMPDEIPIKTLLLEAHCDGILGMQAVGEVIRNRARERNESFDEVCLAKWQFSCWNSRSEANRRLKRFLGADYKLAEMAWRYSKTSNLTKGANLYANLALCSPSWASSQKVKKTVKVLHHDFFKE